MSDLSMKQHATAVDLSFEQNGVSLDLPNANELRLGKRVVELEDERDALLVGMNNHANNHEMLILGRGASAQSASADVHLCPCHLQHGR